MIRFRSTSTLSKAAGALSLGEFLALGASSANAQVAVRPTTAPAPPRVTYGGAYYSPNVYRPGVYYGAAPNGYNRGPVGPGPARDWASARTVPLAKPWMRPLPR